MKRENMIVTIIVVVLLIAGIVWWLVAMSQSTQPSTVTSTIPNTTDQTSVTSPSPGTGTAEVTSIILKNDPVLGSYLTDSNGRTLYFFAKDFDGKSACTGACLNAWPAFYLANVSIGSGLDMEDFATTTRPDGSIQTTYYGWPLYYYAGDAAVGDIKGEGLNKLWFVAKPDYTIAFVNKDNKNYLIDADTGHTLYQYSKDTADVSNCTGTCVQNWPVFTVDKMIAPSFLDISQFRMIARTDNNNQATIRHMPLYYYVKDKIRGDVLGQGVGGFSLVDPLASSTSQ